MDVGSGTGNYAEYTDHTVVNGMEAIDRVFGNGTVSTNYNFSWTFSDSQGTTKTGGSSGNFTWSSVAFLYIRGTDNQTGYVNPKVWFYVDNSAQTGGTFYLLNTLMTVKSGNYGFYLPSQSRYVNTIFAQGSSSYFRNDAYGQFNAVYTWSAYFDPSTGYIIGYGYDEHDSNSSGDGFAYTENLYVTSTSYPLAAGSANSNLFQYLGYIVAIVVFIVVVVVAIYAFSRRRSRMKPPKHAYEQEYRPPPPSGQPPSIDLTPKQPPVQQIVIKEVVKVKCKYCGALIDSTVQVCPLCGAPRT